MSELQGMKNAKCWNIASHQLLGNYKLTLCNSDVQGFTLANITKYLLSYCKVQRQAFLLGYLTTSPHSLHGPLAFPMSKRSQPEVGRKGACAGLLAGETGGADRQRERKCFGEGIVLFFPDLPI